MTSWASRFLNCLMLFLLVMSSKGWNDVSLLPQPLGIAQSHIPGGCRSRNSQHLWTGLALVIGGRFQQPRRGTQAPNGVSGTHGDGPRQWIEAGNAGFAS
ncbi:hypothetical protein AB205_0161210 [Aquarana catesbeiana]|uniref:Secreted protein n=1 Tax=Aquarana catesbeiana TaxID=8400 RepID=A0A2G9P4D3_AQUCT|nr:hypothetical protein AB205_0161210 [Aquarana catesbeiana]